MIAERGSEINKRSQQDTHGSSSQQQKERKKERRREKTMCVTHLWSALLSFLYLYLCVCVCVFDCEG